MKKDFKFRSENMPAIANEKDYKLAADFRDIRKYIQELEERIKELEDNNGE